MTPPESEGRGRGGTDSGPCYFPLGAELSSVSSFGGRGIPCQHKKCLLQNLRYSRSVLLLSGGPPKQEHGNHLSAHLLKGISVLMEPLNFLTSMSIYEVMSEISNLLENPRRILELSLRMKRAATIRDLGKITIIQDCAAVRIYTEPKYIMSNSLVVVAN